MNNTLIVGTPAQKLTIHQLAERHAKSDIWVSYDPHGKKPLKVLFFTPKYLIEYQLDDAGFIKRETAYDNPKSTGTDRW